MFDISIFDTGEISKPVTVLIKKVSNATGALFEPTGIRRKAKAEADARKIHAMTDLEIKDMKRRALARIVIEEVKNQENIEAITKKSFSSLNDDAKPDEIEDDWLRNFFDKCKLISDDMQMIWSKVLAGEANKAGTFSKRTIEFMSTMDKSDAILFDNLCKFCWYTCDKCIMPLLLETHSNDSEPYAKFDIGFQTLKHLSTIGLINISSSGLHMVFADKEERGFNYYGRILMLHLKKEEDVKYGFVSFTKVGSDLMSVIHPIMKKGIISTQYYDDYYHSIVEDFYKQKIILSEPLSNKIYDKK